MAINPSKMCLTPGKTVLFICDVQTAVAKHIFEIDKMLANTAKLIAAINVLKIPILVTEQKRLGPTVSELDISGAFGPFVKSQGSMCTPEVSKVLSTICSGSRPDAVVLAGLETHLCIEHTAMDLRKNGFEVHAVAECISSRTKEDRLFALERMKQMGCYIATSENVIFKIIGDTTYEGMKDILKLIKIPTSHI